MPRAWRFFGKKRGSRRVGASDKAGSFGLCILSAVLLAIGVATFVVILFTLAIPEWRANHEFVEDRCVVVDKRLVERFADDGATYRPEFRVRYDVREHDHEEWATYDPAGVFLSERRASADILSEYEIGEEYPCWRDPTSDTDVVMRLGYTWFAWLTLLLPTPFIVFGVAGLTIYSLRGWQSAEWRAATQGRAVARDFLLPADGARAQFPSVPADDDFTNSPGTHLAFRLPSVSSDWALFVLLVFTLIWNGVALATIAKAVHSSVHDAPVVFEIVMAVAFGAVGAILVYLLAGRFLLAANIGPTLVEIAKHPLYPGDRCEGFFSQTGRLKFDTLCVKLVCEEEATYRQGTDSRTESRVVWEATLYEAENVEISRTDPWSASFEIQAPEDAMHSFEATHNKILWSIVVIGTANGWPSFTRAYRLLVYPSRGALARL